MSRKAGMSLTHGNKRILNRNLALMLYIFQQSEKKPNSLQWEPIIDLERNIAFILHFFLKVELIFPSSGN